MPQNTKPMRLAAVLLFLFPILGYSQIQDSLTNTEKDSLYIIEYEEKLGPPKVLHAEPLYIDLIRDLGARAGEKEWNFGFGLTDNLTYDTYQGLVEYEFAPIDRLGLEIEIPFTFYAGQGLVDDAAIPSSRMESLKLATQWTFLVSEEKALSLALGYINELEFSSFKDFGNPLFKGNVFNPFFVAAKRWGNNFHTLIYTGPLVEHTFSHEDHFSSTHTRYDINTNVHYMISGTRNFVGLEFNNSVTGSDFDMTIRPQMRVGVADNFLIGIVGGIPIDRENQRLSSFVRIIWEPGHKE